MSCIFKNALPLAQTSTTYFYRTPFHFALPLKIQNDLQKSGVQWIFEPILSGVRENGIYGWANVQKLLQLNSFYESFAACLTYNSKQGCAC